MVFETTIKYLRKRSKNPIKVENSRDVYNFLKPLYKENMNYQEEMRAVFFDTANQVICVTTLGIGCVNSCVSNNQKLYQTAILSNCKGVVIAHNHPSGNLKPSEADIKLTKEIQEALKLFRIVLMDHLILTENDYESLADKGYL